MGIFDFVTDAGGKLGGAVFEMLKEDEDITKPVTISAERMNELREKSITDSISELDTEVQNLSVTVSGATATVGGKVATQTCCEKVVLTAGNQHGISQVDSQLQVDRPEPEAKFYTVQSGDTLGKIAQKFYGSAGSYTKIFEANQPMLTDPNKIYVGQALRIPADS